MLVTGQIWQPHRAKLRMLLKGIDEALENRFLWKQNILVRKIHIGAGSPISQSVSLHSNLCGFLYSLNLFRWRRHQLNQAFLPAGENKIRSRIHIQVAFNILNYGRFKLAAAAGGGGLAVIAEAARYAVQRKQFGQPISNFGAIKHKLGEMTVRAYAVESMVYRTAGLLDSMLEGHGPQDDGALLAALEEYAVESSILKVAGSEMLNFAIDENVQIHGGNGFVKDYPAERHYRDSRVNRIFEGTNEINRLLIPGMLIRRALKGSLELIPAAKTLQDEVMSPPSMEAVGDGLLEEQTRAVAAFKKVALMVIGVAMQTYGEKLTNEQEVLSYTADILIDTFAAETVVLRALQASSEGQATAELQAAAARVATNDAAMRIEMAARQALAAMAEGDTLRTQLAALRRLLKVTPINTVTLRRRLADAAVTRAGYPFSG